MDLRELPTVELLSDSSWSTATSSQLDLTTHTSRQDIAVGIGKELCEDYDEMSQVMRCVGSILRVNETACIGANRAGSHTRKHQHAPMGVLNLLGGAGGASKRWHLWPPGEAAVPPEVLDQRPGQVLWLPPGWYHEVWTTGGVVVASSADRHEIVAPYWTTWCLPKRLALRSLCALLAGITSENQLQMRRVSAAQKRELYAVMDAYANSG